MSPSRTSTRWLFIAPACPRATGGDIARFELANAIARERGHGVAIAHVPTHEMIIRDLGDVPWFDFDPAVDHHFQPDLDPTALPDADIVVYSTKLIATALAPAAREVGQRLVRELQPDRDRPWLPILLLQGHGVFQAPVEEAAFGLPGLKVCVGSWLADVAASAGVPVEDIAHIPNGIDPKRFNIIRPIPTREPSVAMNFDDHRAKRGKAGLRALKTLQRLEAVPATLFGTVPVARSLGPAVRFLAAPSQDTLAREVYNESALFLQPSGAEGFGLCAVEAMACGCALVTTSNGGSDDYAFHEETAIVCGGQPGEMAEAMARLVRDDALRIRIATDGARFVERFRWTTSARQLVAVAAQGLADSARHRSGAPVDLGPALRILSA